MYIMNFVDAVTFIRALASSFFTLFYYVGKVRDKGHSKRKKCCCMLGVWIGKMFYAYKVTNFNHNRRSRWSSFRLISNQRRRDSTINYTRTNTFCNGIMSKKIQ